MSSVINSIYWYGLTYTIEKGIETKSSSTINQIFRWNILLLYKQVKTIEVIYYITNLFSIIFPNS